MPFAVFLINSLQWFQQIKNIRLIKAHFQPCLSVKTQSEFQDMRYVMHNGKHFSVEALLPYKLRIFLLPKKSSKAENVRILLIDTIKSNVLLSSKARMDIMNILGCFCNL